MAKPKSSPLVVEALETRCLLNGAMDSTALPGQATPDAVTPLSDVPSQSVVAPRSHASEAELVAASAASLRPAYTQAMYRAPSSSRDDNGARAPSTLGQDQDAAPSATALAPVQWQTAGLWPPQTIVGRPVDIIVQTPVPVVDLSQVSRPEAVVVEEMPQISIVVYVKRSSYQAGNVEEIASQRLSLAAELPPPGKEPGSVPVQLHDAGAAVMPAPVPISQAALKEERLTQPAHLAAQPGRANALAPGFGALADVPPLVPQNGLDGHGRGSPAATVHGSPARPDGMETRLVEFTALPFLAPAVLGSTLSSLSALPTNVLPFDFSSLEFSIKDFFDHVEQLGQKLSERQVNILFSAGAAAAIAALALELTRRGRQPVAPALSLRREGSIPFSDYT